MSRREHRASLAAVRRSRQQGEIFAERHGEDWKEWEEHGGDRHGLQGLGGGGPGEDLLCALLSSRFVSRAMEGTDIIKIVKKREDEESGTCSNCKARLSTIR